MLLVESWFRSVCVSLLLGNASHAFYYILELTFILNNSLSVIKSHGIYTTDGCYLFVVGKWVVGDISQIYFNDLPLTVY